MKRSFREGFPDLPLRYENNDQTYIIENLEDLTYKFEFKLLKKTFRFAVAS